MVGHQLLNGHGCVRRMHPKRLAPLWDRVRICMFRDRLPGVNG